MACLSTWHGAVVLLFVCFGCGTEAGLRHSLGSSELNDAFHTDLKWNAKTVEANKLRDSIETVHIVFMNHLDVGYKSFINNVVNEYFHKYFPLAIQVWKEQKDGGFMETFIYTTHPWLVSLYLDCPPNVVLAGVKLLCPNATQKASFIAAVNAGAITWHAGPMNLQVEMAADPWLFEFGLDISAQLDKKFNITRNFRVLSQRDVPGITQAAIPSLVRKGVRGVSVGVNNGTPPPAVPQLFIWKRGNDAVMGTWHPGGYPDNPGSNPSNPGGLSRHDCVVVAGLKDALCFAFRTDNSGPPVDFNEVLGYYEILRVEFPNAVLEASHLENFFEAAQSVASQLPVVENEIGDVWILGVASDPRKCAEYRAVSRVMANCVTSGVCSMTDVRVWNASRFLIKLPEHTWGLPSENDNIHWSNKEFIKLRDKADNFIQCRLSWLEQREFTYLTVEALQDHPVVKDIMMELSQLKSSWPDLTNFKPVSNMAQVFQCPSSGIQQLQFDVDGSIRSLVRNGVTWSDAAHRLGQFLYRTYNETDFVSFGKLYDYNPLWSAGFDKANITRNAHPNSSYWPVIMSDLYQSNNAAVCDFYVTLEMFDGEAVTLYGAPLVIWLRYTVRSGTTNAGIDIDLQLFDKTSTRMPEALLFAFSVTPQPGYKWMMFKMGQLVDPLNVLLNGSQYQHVTDDHGVFYGSSTGTPGMQLRSPDVPLTCPIITGNEPHVFPAPLGPISTPITGTAFNIYNNIWETNYIMWYPYIDGDQDFRARFYVDFK